MHKTQLLSPEIYKKHLQSRAKQMIKGIYKEAKRM